MRNKQFEHLNVPNHWRQYYTRYPEGYTILEALLNWVQQVDEMVDNQNELNKTVENYRDELDDFLKQFDGELKETVKNVLADWQESGFLNVVINDALETKYHEMDDRLTSEIKKTQKVINIKEQYGAMGDGVSDDSQKIQQAFDEAPPGSTVILPPTEESYILDWKIIITKPVTFKGYGAKLKLKDQSSLFHEGGRTSLLLIKASNVHIEGLEIDGNSRNNYVEDSEGRRIYYAEHSDESYPNGINNISFSAEDGFIENVGVVNSKSYDASSSAISFNGGFSSSSDNFDNSSDIIENGYAYNNVITKCQRSVLVATTGCRNIRFINNYLYNTYWRSIFVYTQCENVLIEGNMIKYNQETYEGDNLSFIGASTDSPGPRMGIRVGHSTRSPGTVKKITIKNNIVESIDPSWSYQYMEMIFVAGGTEDFIIESNTIINGHRGIKIEKSNTGTITNNICQGCGISAFIDNSLNISLSNNVFSKTDNFNVRLVNDNENITINNNNIIDSGQQGVAATGTHLIITNNLIDVASGRGISGSNLHDSVISHNTILNTDSAALRISGDNMSIDSNYIQNCCLDTTVTERRKIILLDGEKTNIVNNTVRKKDSPASQAIRVEDGRDVLIKNNDIIDMTIFDDGEETIQEGNRT